MVTTKHEEPLQFLAPDIILFMFCFKYTISLPEA